MSNTKYIVTGEELFENDCRTVFYEFKDFTEAKSFYKVSNADPHWSYRLFVIEKEIEDDEITVLNKLEEI